MLLWNSVTEELRIVMEKKNNAFVRYVISFITIIVLALVDQYTKFLIVQNIPVGKEVSVIGDGVVLTQLHNTGAAWSSFSGKISFLLIITLLVSVLLI